MSHFLFISDYDYEEPKKKGKGGKCMKGKLCGKAEKDSKEDKEGKGIFLELAILLKPNCQF